MGILKFSAMPAYELSLVVRQMAKESIKATVKRTATLILQNGGIIKHLECLGERNLPQKQNKDGELHSRGTYFIMNCDLRTKDIPEFDAEIGLDNDVLRRNFLSVEKTDLLKSGLVCTLEDELKSPADRPSIQALIEQGRRPPKFTKPFKFKTGLNYYPFAR